MGRKCPYPELVLLDLERPAIGCFLLAKNFKHCEPEL